MSLPQEVQPDNVPIPGEDEHTFTELARVPDPETNSSVRLHLGRQQGRAYVAASSEPDGTVIETGSTSDAMFSLSRAYDAAGRIMRTIENTSRCGPAKY